MNLQIHVDPQDQANRGKRRKSLKIKDIVFAVLATAAIIIVCSVPFVIRLYIKYLRHTTHAPAAAERLQIAESRLPMNHPLPSGTYPG